MSRIQDCISDVATCAVCNYTKMGRLLDLDLRGFVCDECAPELAAADDLLLNRCGFLPPDDPLIEAHL